MDGLSPEHTKAGRIQRALLTLIGEHKEDGTIPTNGRFLFYELEQAGVVPKKYENQRRQPSQEVSEALTRLREVGLVPWPWINDEARRVDDWEVSSSVYEYAREACRYARIDLWDGEPAPLIICEAGGVHGVLRNLAGEYLVPITATKGQCKGHIVTKVAPLLEDSRRIVAYVGDFELRGPGEQIEEHTRRAIEEHAGRVFNDYTWQRIALTAEQVQSDPRLRSLVIEKTDGRFKPPRKYEAVECEAMKQAVLVRIVREWLDDQLPEPIEVVREREAEQRTEIAKMFET